MVKISRLTSGLGPFEDLQTFLTFCISVDLVLWDANWRMAAETVVSAQWSVRADDPRENDAYPLCPSAGSSRLSSLDAFRPVHASKSGLAGQVTKRFPDPRKRDPA